MHHTLRPMVGEDNYDDSRRRERIKKAKTVKHSVNRADLDPFLSARRFLQFVRWYWQTSVTILAQVIKAELADLFMLCCSSALTFLA